MNAKRKTATDQLEIPDFLRRKNDPKTKAREAKEWDTFLAKQRTGSQQTTAATKVNWLKPLSMSDEEFERLTAQRDEEKTMKSRARIAKMVNKVDTRGKRWDMSISQWVDDGAVATKSVVEKAAAMQKPKKVSVEVPTTGILAEFKCKPGTYRAKLLLTLEKSLGKMVTGPVLCKAVYDDASQISKLIMVVKGAEATIIKEKLTYELKDKNHNTFGLFKLKGKGK